MNRDAFQRLAAEGYNRIPLTCETLADFDTPLSIYLKLADGANSYLLESVQGGEKWGRYSIIGLPCRTVLRVYGHSVSISVDGVESERFDCEDPLAFVEQFKERYRVPTLPGLPRFNGGLVGYFGYDCVRYVEKRLGASPNPDPLGVPDILLMVSDAVVVFDNLAGKMHAIVLVDPAEEQAFEQGQARLQGLLETLRQPITPRRGLDLSGPQAAEPEFRSSYTREDYENAVGRIKEYILAGDCMQVVPPCGDAPSPLRPRRSDVRRGESRDRSRVRRHPIFPVLHRMSLPGDLCASTCGNAKGSSDGRATSAQRVPGSRGGWRQAGSCGGGHGGAMLPWSSRRQRASADIDLAHSLLCWLT